MSFHWVFRNGDELVQVHDIDTVCENLKQLYSEQESQINYLRIENQKLKDEHWKDKELQDMQRRVESLQSRLRHGFEIDDDEADMIEKWRIKHMAERHGCKTLEDRLRAGGAIGGSISYEFIPTSIGNVGIVYCGACRRKAFMDAKGDYESYCRLRKGYDSEMEFQSL